VVISCFFYFFDFVVKTYGVNALYYGTRKG
jgi:hypothetical protein